MTAPTLRGDLARSLHDRIARSGPITFAEFMEAALYDPEHGFYSAHGVGRSGEFLTSPHLSPVFGRLLARQVLEFRSSLGDPEPLHVVELGAGDGTLARQILAALEGSTRAVIHYVGVEPSPAGRAALASVDKVDAAPAVDDVGPFEAGCVLANELLDNMPFHRVRGTSEGPRELSVGSDGHRFLLVQGDPSSEEIAAAARTLRPGEEGIVPVQACRLVERAAAVFERGFLWFCDYGWASSTVPAGVSVHGYRAHRLKDDVLEDPGSRDITTGVNFAALAQHATEAGLAAWGPVTQRSALLALGFRRLEAAALARQAELLDARRGVDAMRIYSDRNAANLLVAQPGMGNFLVICLSKGVDEPPPAFAEAMRLDAESGRPRLLVDVADDEKDAPQHRDQIRDERAG